jgi:hypothetical protein
MYFHDFSQQTSENEGNARARRGLNFAVRSGNRRPSQYRLPACPEERPSPDFLWSRKVGKGGAARARSC